MITGKAYRVNQNGAMSVSAIKTSTELQDKKKELCIDTVKQLKQRYGNLQVADTREASPICPVIKKSRLFEPLSLQGVSLASSAGNKNLSIYIYKV